MKTFILRSVFFFVLAGIVTVGVYLYVTKNLSTSAGTPSAEVVKESLKDAVVETKSETETAVSDLVEKVPKEGIPLSSLPLTDSHKKALSAVNIDVETFVLTPEMITCGGEKLGATRIEEIIAGAAPSVLEITKLIPCLTR
ncbi:MAG: hypothetical protein RL538_18 [Candidatus Parcubacteria bacterium]|jgi:hypothetical protein